MEIHDRTFEAPPTDPLVASAAAGLSLESVPLAELAREHGTPLFAYSGRVIRENYARFAEAFPDASIAYSVKANGNLALLRLLASLGAGFDIVSGGELERVLRIGADPARVIFAGVGKSRPEIIAALRAGVAEFNVESEGEAARLDAIAGELGLRAPVALRLNPDIDAGTHHYITTGRRENKFGLWEESAFRLAGRIGTEFSHLTLRGIHLHLGSQIREKDVYEAAARFAHGFISRLPSRASASLETINFGGGFGVDYERGGIALDPAAVAPALRATAGDLGLRLLLEPGRSIIANAGVLLTTVEYVKRGEEKDFVIVDAAMTDLLRPALYGAYHRIVPVAESVGETRLVDIVGPVCESGDFLGQSRRMVPPVPGDLLAVLDTGAYGFAMASNYNSRLRPAEVLVENGSATLIRRRETIDDLLATEV